MRKKVFLYMCGGLGNQLFQYSAGKNLALMTGRTLHIDTMTGFWTDFRDSWRFSLNKKKLKNVNVKAIVLTFIFYRFLKKIFKFKKLFVNFFGCIVVDETTINFYNDTIKQIDTSKNIYLIGYFQSEKYFLENKKKIIKDIIPKTPISKKFISMKKIMANKNSVSLGIRLHETMPDKIKYKVGGETELLFYKKSIDKILKKIKKPEFFLFSTKTKYIHNIIEKFPLLMKHKLHFITPENGFENAYDNIWLMSYCKNHIISNSTLYWWGVYFSQLNYKKQIICCANNFHNKDTCKYDWEN